MAIKNLSKEVIYAARELIGSRLRELREQKQITQVELAARIGCGSATISKIEAGLFFPAMDMFLAILSELDAYFFISEKESNAPLPQLMREAMK